MYFETATDSKRRGGQDRGFQLRPQTLPENWAHVDRRCLQKDIVAFAAAATAFDPEHGIGIVILQQKSQMGLYLLRAAEKVVDLFWFLRQVFEFRADAMQALIECDELFAIFFEEFATVFEGEAAFSAAAVPKRKTALRSRRLLIAPESPAVYILLRWRDASTSRASSSIRTLLRVIPK